MWSDQSAVECPLCCLLVLGGGLSFAHTHHHFLNIIPITLPSIRECVICNFAANAGLSEEDAELLAPAPTPTPAANLPSSSGKADAAWEEDSDFPDLAGSGTSRKAESNGTPPAAPLPPPADAVAGRMPPGNGRSGAEPPVSFPPLSLCNNHAANTFLERLQFDIAGVIKGN